MKTHILSFLLLFTLAATAGETPIPNGRFTGTGHTTANSILRTDDAAILQAEPQAILKGVSRAPRYAVFYIPLGIYNASYKDIEIKGTINNFTGKAADALVYFYGSAYGSQQTTHGPIGYTKSVFYTDNRSGTNHGLARQWQKQDMSRSIFEQASSPTAVIGGVVVVVPITEIINPHNEKLIFVYQRISPESPEEIWVPIAPQWTIVDPRLTPDSDPVPPNFVNY